MGNVAHQHLSLSVELCAKSKPDFREPHSAAHFTRINGA
jgi:hypothetical protein